MAAFPLRAESVRLQERDLALLTGLFESRVMTAEHIAVLFFDGRREAAKKRLQKLKKAGLVGERKRRASDPAILSITRKGLLILRENGTLATFPSFHLPALEKRARVSELTLRHELEVMDVKAAVCSAIKHYPSLSVAEFCTWPLVHQFEVARSGNDGREVLVKPDGFIRIHETEADEGLSEHTFFLEVDRSSENLDALLSRAGCYLHYYKSGAFAARNGGLRSAYKEYPFRVLMVFKTAERRNNIAEKLINGNPPILTQVWLSTIDEVRSDPLGAIWTQPLDYQDAIKETAFDVAHRQRPRGYRRQTDREIFLDSKMKKRPLVVADARN